ncbi:hypothetical protein [Robertmurraya kyonggiensis]|uniref:Uncharacterized protein n=1 Tax=Robertmurraya kyonggiensis TaxID=1037680 RepID=A0A4U1DA38_9BACI|nr:hypothetical protein [Robertmurraya kyonggiensis]TKC19324.1 hypothetical protein FA727_07235 [Robertmurraya kyonggiensis]
MDKHDFRIQFPLWNIALLSILMIWCYSVVYAADMLFNDFEGTILPNGEIHWNIFGLISFFVGFVLLIVFFVAYFLKLHRYNKEHPNNRLTAFTSMKPHEILEDDELFQQVSEKATKKVYIFYSNYLPLVILLMAFPLHRFVFIFVILLLLIIQNAIYYRHLRQYVMN